ncbi:hypothetical protein ACMATS_36725 [Streptoverticillium reticulum]|uniref:hypothetical protein n=1 Tax=Streptoverticillium reticulum TaxID=1433415 RepID=UPI0039BF6479
MSLRKTSAIALLACTAALSLTACGPNSSSDDKASSKASSKPSAAPGSAAPAQDGTSDKHCGNPKPGHKEVIVDSESAESGEIDYHEVKGVSCKADGTHKWQSTGKTGTSHLAHGDTKVQLIDDKGQLTSSSTSAAKDKLLECWHHPKTTPHGPCLDNSYDIVDQGRNVGITELMQLKGE